MAKSMQLRTAFWCYLMVFWSAAAYAAENSFAAGMESIPFQSIKYVLFLAAIGGAAGTLNKVSNPDLQVRSIWLEIIKDIFASLVVGLIIFFFTSWTTLNFWIQAGLITIGGFGGTKTLDHALVNGLFPWIGRIFGKVSKDAEEGVK